MVPSLVSGLVRRCVVFSSTKSAVNEGFFARCSWSFFSSAWVSAGGSSSAQIGSVRRNRKERQRRMTGTGKGRSGKRTRESLGGGGALGRSRVRSARSGSGG